MEGLGSGGRQGGGGGEGGEGGGEGGGEKPSNTVAAFNLQPPIT